MAWITDAELKTAIAGALGVASSAELPAHIGTNLVTVANGKAYKKLRAVLMGRGFTAAQLDDWEARTEWNTRLGVLYALLEASKRGEAYPTQLMEDYKQALEELKEEQIVVADEIALPVNGRVGTGDLDTGADRFTLDEPDGSGDFTLGDGTRL